MAEQAPMPTAQAQPQAEEAPKPLTVETMMSNYEGMDEDNKNAIGQLMQDPITGILDNLTGGTMFSEFSQGIQGGAAPAPAPQEGIMGPGPEMEAPATPAPTAMAKGGLTAQVHDMMKQGMSRQEILNQIGQVYLWATQTRPPAKKEIQNA